MSGSPRSLQALDRFLSLEEENGVAIVQLTEDVIELGLDLDAHHRLWRLFEDLRSSSEVRSVVVLATGSCFAPERCDRLLDQIRASRSGQPSRQWVPLEENAARYIVQALVGLPHPVAMVFEGEVDLLALGPALACDFRLASTDTVFVNRCHEIGIPPGFGLAGLLPLYIGLGRARKMLLKPARISAGEALEMGIVDEVVPPNLRHVAQSRARDFAGLDPQVVRSVKRLLRIHLPDLQRHFDAECREMEYAVSHAQEGRLGGQHGLRPLF